MHAGCVYLMSITPPLHVQDAKALCGLMEEASSAWRGAGALPPAPAELMASVDLTKARVSVRFVAVETA